MTYSSLKRKTPLKRSGFKRKYPPSTRDAEQPSNKEEKAAPKGGKGAKTARKPSKSSLETHLDIVFSLYIRLRDAMQGGLTRCISCGRALPFEQMQCGHFFSRANHSTRWDEMNCNSECVRCNRCDDGHLEGYERNPIAKIGQEPFDELCVRARGTRKWSGEELRDMIRHYTSEARRLSKEKGIKVKI